VAIAPHEELDVSADELRPPAPELATFVPGLARRFRELAQVARTTVPVVIFGESGTGKEVAAQALHRLSGRTGPFVAVNCGSLPANLVETELYGYKKGAFSGAAEDRPGLVRASDGGTLFLDEIGDLPETSQAALLRVLQEREVTPVGATRPLKVDLRVVCATHRDLEGMARRGEFRQDLLARLTGFRLELLPLRERREDFGLIVRSLLQRLLPDDDGVAFTCKAARALLGHGWPLNVRELEQALSAALPLAADGPIDTWHLPEAIRGFVRGKSLSTSQERKAAKEKEPAAAAGDEPSEEQPDRKQELEALLIEHRGNVAAVARAMGKAPMQIHRWLRRYKLALEDYRKP
jgi:DNA-binding NtrC family response regulator